jgi:hypothetical protein
MGLKPHHMCQERRIWMLRLENNNDKKGYKNRLGSKEEWL